MHEQERSVIAAVQARQPLVHCLTAVVSMDLVANGLLAAGARPMMTETPAEAPTMTAVADALLINLGTLSTDGLAGMEPTVAASNAAGHPWVLDPTAVGLAPVRTPLARRLVQLSPAVVRGNASEVLALAGAASGGRGADAGDQVAAARGTAQTLALQTGGVVAVSGATDLITNGHRDLLIAGGTALLTRVTGTGCLLGALTAACVAVSDPWQGAAAASWWMKTAGEWAAARASGPGSFRMLLLDGLDEVGR